MAIEKIATIPFAQIAEIGIHQNLPSKRLNAAQVKALYEADYVMNLGFYNMNLYIPTMALKVNDVWAVKENNLEGISFDKTGVDFCKADDSLRKNFVAGYPTLIRGNKITDFETPFGLSGNRGRSGIGIGPDYSLMLGCTGDSWSSDDYTLEEFADEMYNQGAKAFINVDGGASSQGIFPDGIVSSSRIVQNFIYIRLFKPVYRVQLGAFRNHVWAEAFLDGCKEALNNDGILTSPFLTKVYM